jgi:hypothetical protein
MASSRKGRLSPITGAVATDITTLPTDNPHQLCYYSEGFDSQDGFINDQVICHGAANGRDKTDPSPGLRQSSGSMNVPMDVAMLSYFMPMLCGAATSEVEDAGVSPSKWTRTFVSGLDTQVLSAFSLPVTDDKWKLIHPSYLNTLSFNVGKQDGFRTMDLGFLTSDVETVTSEPTFAGAASPRSYTHRKVPGEVGTMSIDGTVVAQLIDGTFNFSNQAELINLADGTNRALGLEPGDTQIRTDMTMRVVSGVGVNDILDLFKGAQGPSFAATLNFPIDANASLEVSMPFCKGERRSPIIGGSERQTFSAPFEAFQDGGNPAATFTLINQEA